MGSLQFLPVLEAAMNLLGAAMELPGSYPWGCQKLPWSLLEAAMGYWKLPWTYHGAARSCHGHTWELPWSYLGAIIEVWGATIELPEATCAGTVFMGTGADIPRGYLYHSLFMTYVQ
jgi:hypothetical protein